MVDNIMMVKSDNIHHKNNDEQKPQTHYFKHGYIKFNNKKFASIDHNTQLYYSVWVWIDDGTKLILKESGKIKEN